MDTTSSSQLTPPLATAFCRYNAFIASATITVNNTSQIFVTKYCLMLNAFDKRVVVVYFITYLHFLSNENEKDNGAPDLEPNGSGSAQGSSSDENNSSKNGDDKKSESKLQVPVLSLVSFAFGTNIPL